MQRIPTMAGGKLSFRVCKPTKVDSPGSLRQDPPTMADEGVASAVGWPCRRKKVERQRAPSSMYAFTPRLNHFNATLNSA